MAYYHEMVDLQSICRKIQFGSSQQTVKLHLDLPSNYITQIEGPLFRVIRLLIKRKRRP